MDFIHAVLGAAVADLLVLDGRWKKRVLKVAPPRDYDWVCYRPELDSFLTAFEEIGVGP